MWLFYFYYFAEAIERNYRLGSGADPSAEFPNKYSYILYVMIDALRNWIGAIRYVPAGQTNCRMESILVEHENGNPVKSAVIAMGECVGVLATSTRIPRSFKEYILGIVLNLTVELMATPTRGEYGEALLNSLVEAGGWGAADNEDYLGTLLAGIIENDNVPHMMARRSELERAIATVCTAYLSKFGKDALGAHIHFESHGDTLVLHSRRGYRYEVPLGPKK